MAKGDKPLFTISCRWLCFAEDVNNINSSIIQPNNIAMDTFKLYLNYVYVLYGMDEIKKYLLERSVKVLNYL